GGLVMLRKSDLSGSYGANTGAAIAMTRISAATQPQNADRGERRAKCRKPRPKRRQRPGSAVRETAAAGSSGRAVSRSVAVIDSGSSIADSGIEPGDRHIDQDIQHHEHDGIEKHQVLHNED